MIFALKDFTNQPHTATIIDITFSRFIGLTFDICLEDEDSKTRPRCVLLSNAVVTPLRKAASYEQRKTNLGIIIIMLDLYSASLCYHLYALYIIIRQS